MGGSSDSGFHIFMALLGLYFVGQLVWSLRDIAKIPKKPKSPKPKSDNSDVRLMWSSYRAARMNGASISESIQSAIDVVTEFQKTGRLAGVGDRPVSPPLPVVTPAARTAGIAHAILVNAVTLVGVFRLRWPVGTALALYWTETVISTFLLLLLLGVWRYGRQIETRGGSVGEVIAASMIFSAAHFVFLLLFLKVILPRYSAAERFERSSFEEGLILIGAIVAIDFAIRAVTIRRTAASDFQRSAELQMQRLAVMHLTIIFGMFALALFGSARAFFAVFCGLKTLIDLTRSN